MSQTSVEPSAQAIAIVGIGCRFPGGGITPASFWRSLLAGADATSDIPSDRWDLDLYYHPDPSQPGKMYTRRAGFLPQVGSLDAAFFNISPAEASQMDPQQGLLLETAWEALEDAGLVAQTLAGSATGVFIGLTNYNYGARSVQDIDTLNVYSNAGNTACIAANRISYQLDLRGPSFTVDTASSSSLVAVHLACESLCRGECSLALAGAAHLLLEPESTIGFCKASMLSPSDRCRAFDADANGFVRGEGAAVLVLKPLSQALADGNPIYALIRATAMNHNGYTPGLHHPNREAQEKLLHDIYTRAGVAPQQVRYVETHGTGTRLGDITEAHALGTVLGQPRPEGEQLWIGSVKPQIGHLEAASGIAGLVKATLILKHRQIPANVNFKTPNPHIPFEELRLKVLTQPTTLPVDETPLIVGVNNFGFGGANAHVILQEYIQPTEVARTQAEAVEQTHAAFLLPLSARSPEALRELARAYLGMLAILPLPSLRDLCYSACLHREHYPYRLAVVARSHDELRDKLLAFLKEDARIGMTSGFAHSNQPPSIAFVFSGNGSQWWSMGKQLLAENPLFRSVVEECDRLFARYADWSLLEELQAPEEAARLSQITVGQPALFVLQLALCAVWQSWGIEPRIVLGHSMGEIAALYIASKISLEDALRVVFHRSRLQELTIGSGKMLAVNISEQEALTLLSDYQERVSIALFNAPGSVTLAGETAILERLAASFEAREVFCRFLPLDAAFHGPAMDPIRTQMLESLAGLHIQPGSLRFVSSVTGRELEGLEDGTDYYWRNVRCPVRFSEAFAYLLQSGFSTFLEIGPHPVLSHYMREGLLAAEKQGTVLSSLQRLENEQATLLGSLGALYTLGASPHWEALVQGGRFIPLPLYPWQREHYLSELDRGSRAAAPHKRHNGNHAEKQSQARVSNKTRVQERQEDILPRLKQADPEQRPELLLSYMRRTLQRVLGQPLAALRPEVAVDLGVNSLMSLELRNILKQDLGVEMPMTQLIGARNIAEMTTFLMKRLLEKVPL